MRAGAKESGHLSWRTAPTLSATDPPGFPTARMATSQLDASCSPTATKACRWATSRRTRNPSIGMSGPARREMSGLDESLR
jgi:hypothetical protein